MAMAQLQQDVVYTRDSQNNVIIDHYAKALEIAQCDDPQVWEYESLIRDRAIVHYAKLLGSARVGVQGTQAMDALTPNVNYNVYVELKLEENAIGFHDNVIFTYTDGQQVKVTSVILHKGVNMVLVGQFVPPSIGIFPMVNVNLNTQPLVGSSRKGLVVRRMSFTTATVN